jgi:hypothetical protein
MQVKHKKNCAVEKNALKSARALEKIPELTETDVKKIYNAALEESRRLEGLLRPEWFVKDIDKPIRKKGKK